MRHQYVVICLSYDNDIILLAEVANNKKSNKILDLFVRHVFGILSDGNILERYSLSNSRDSEWDSTDDFSTLFGSNVLVHMGVGADRAHPMIGATRNAI